MVNSKLTCFKPIEIDTISILKNLFDNPRNLDKIQNMEKFERITIDPKVFGGKPCIRGMRFPVSKILNLLASGMTIEDILRDYPYLEREDILQAIKYSA